MNFLFPKQVLKSKSVVKTDWHIRGCYGVSRFLGCLGEENPNLIVYPNMSSVFASSCTLYNHIPVLKIRGGDRDNLGIIFHIFPLKHIL